MRVLIVEDGRDSYLLPAVRSFGAAGWTVGLGGARSSRAASSRWVRATHPVPPAEDGLDDFAAAVAAAVRTGGYDVVFGGDDVEVLALSAMRDRIGALVPYAPHEAVVAGIDKLRLTQAARAAGIATPRTSAVTVGDPAPAEGTHVVKARLHWTPGAPAGMSRLVARVCATPAEVEEAVAHVVRAGGSPILQEAIEGRLMAVTALCAPGGEVVAESHQVAGRVSPVRRTSTRAETVPVDDGLSAAVGRLLGNLGWSGIANLQFLVPADGTPRLIDLNGRFYGSIALALAAGLDLPVLWVRLASGRAVAPPRPLHGRPGVRYQSLEEDLRRARVERRGGLALDVASTLAYAPTATHSTWRASDPSPSLARVRQLVQQRRSPRRPVAVPSAA
jgi:predicted ATP-grasp superfamily ATP-dependent carboligase